MIGFFIKRPAMTIMFVLIFVVMGIVSYFNLIIESTPRIEFPFVTVKTVYNGASPEEIETQIIKKIEDVVAEISQIKQIQSQAFENYGYVFIEFQMDSDVNVKSMEVKDKVETILNDLPKDALKPEISKFDPLIQPIVDLVLSSDNIDERTLFEYADKKLKNIISVTEGVASVNIYGGKKRQINIKLDPMLMKKYFIAIRGVIEAIDKSNVNIPGGSIDRAENTSSVRMMGEYTSIEDIKNTVIVSPEGQKIKLADIATVEDSFKKIETYTRYNGRNVIGLSIKKLSDGDAVSIVKKIKKTIKIIKDTLPQGMDLIIAYDSTEHVLSETRGTIINIIYGIILTVLILFFFLGDWRVTIVAGVVIPTALISAFFPMDFSQFTINFITLLAIGTALGTLIANALVIIDGIYLHLSYGKDRIQAAIDGTKEVAVAVFATAGTNLVVFTPVAFMSGVVGQFMKQFGLTVVYATLFSILASFTLTPMMCALLLKPLSKDNEKEKGLFVIRKIRHWSNTMMSFLTEEYKAIFKRMFIHPRLVLIVCFLLFIGGCFPMKYVGNEFFPGSDQNKIGITIKMPQGTLLEKTLTVTRDLEILVKDLPEVASYLSYVGVDGSENGTITINLLPMEKRDRSDLEIIAFLILEVAKIPDAEIQFARGETHGLAEGDITVNVFGDDYDAMVRLSEHMKETMMYTGFFRSVESSYKIPKEEIRFMPDNQAMVQYGMQNSDVGETIRSAISGDDNNVYKEKGEEYKINIDYDDYYKASLKDIADIAVMTRDGLIPIAQMGKVAQAPGFASILRRDKNRVIQLNGYLSKSTAGQVRTVIDQEFKKITFPQNYFYRYAGTAEFQDESNRELGRAFLLAIILTYMLIVASMNSFLDPFIIVLTIATSFVGVFLILFFLNFSLNIGSQMAIIMLVGIVVNSSILMLDYTTQKLSEGIDIKEALWLGASVKFRAILMTSIAVVVGAFPQLFDPFAGKASMGAVIVGGVLASIFFTFIMVPVLFWYSFRLKMFVKKLFIKNVP